MVVNKMEKYDTFLNSVVGEKESMVKQLISWASINSSSYNFDGLEKMLNLLKKDFSILPGKVEIISLSNNSKDPKGLLITCRPDAPIQVFLCGHYDTVYGKEDRFQKCTFTTENKLQGPGVTDMKGGLLVMLKVLQTFEKTPWVRNIGWQVFLNPDEEIGSNLSIPLFYEAAKKFNFGLIFEPAITQGALVRFRKGTGVFSVTVHGRAAHAGRALANGRNAIVLLADIILQINDLSKEFKEALFNVASVQGGGPDNVVPDLAEIKINIRYSNQKDKEAIQRRLNEICDSANKREGYKVEIKGSFHRPPKNPSKGTEDLYNSLHNCGKELGFEVGWIDSGGASDGNFLEHAGLPNIDNLGVRGDNIHSDAEFVYIDSMIERTQLTLLFLMKLASGQLSLSKEFYPNQ